MSKAIMMNNEEIATLLENIRKQLQGQKCFGGLEIKKDFPATNKTARVVFTPIAWVKMKGLVEQYDTEVQWHAMVERTSKEGEFLVIDILVPPHTVAAATVISDDAKYTEWINSLEDEIFNCLRFHGHSHVNMGVTPSSVDMKYREDLVTQLPVPKNTDGDSFYMFFIFNKKGEWSGQIYDLNTNTLYDTADISIDVQLDETGYSLSGFVAEAKKVAVKEEPKVTVPAASKAWYDGYNKGYGGGYYGSEYYTGGKDWSKPETETKKETKKEAKKEKIIVNPPRSKSNFSYYDEEDDWYSRGYR